MKSKMKLRALFTVIPAVLMIVSLAACGNIQTDNPNLSVNVIPIGKGTSDLSVFDDLSSRETITFSLAEGK